MRITGPKGGDIQSVADWEKHAGPKQAIHWKAGRSAMESARAWCGDNGPCVPEELTQLLESHPDTKGAIFESVWPEHRVKFDDIKGEPRNSDIAALAHTKSGDLAISVEAKADEPFDIVVGEVVMRGQKKLKEGERTGSVERAKGLLKALFGDRAENPGLEKLRYQLLTGVAGALAFARQKKAQAVFVVHEFLTPGPSAKRETNTQDLDAFVRAISNGSVRSLAYGKLQGPIVVGSEKLYIGKVRRELQPA